MIADCVEKTIRAHNLLASGQGVLVGFSGGADSCALLFSLKTLGYGVSALHINHCIRGAEADSDTAFCKDLCEKNGIPFYVEYVDVPDIAKSKRLSLETAARIERMRIFKEYSAKLNCPVAVAHNKCDQAETVLMHLFRGSGLNGLQGIKYKSDFIIRPLLDASRAEIEDFCKGNGINFVTDSTNLTDDYTRNKIRRKILPQVAEIYPASINAISKCAESLSAYADFIDIEAEKIFSERARCDKNSVKLEICEMHPAMRYEVIKKAIIRLKGDAVDIDSVHIDSALSLLSMQSGREIYLPHNIIVRRVYDTLEFSFKESNVSLCADLIKGVPIPFGDKIIFAENVEKRIPRGECLDEANLPANAVIRTRLEGDRIKIINSCGFCSLKKYFIDKKIPVTIRNSIPLVAVDNTILAVIGYTVADSVKITGSTEKIINIYIGEKL